MTDFSTSIRLFFVTLVTNNCNSILQMLVALSAAACFVGVTAQYGHGGYGGDHGHYDYYVSIVRKD